jgi:hypothetical protein
VVTILYCLWEGSTHALNLVRLPEVPELSIATNDMGG